MAPDLPLMLAWVALESDVDLAAAQLLLNLGHSQHARILRAAGEEEQAELLVRGRGVGQKARGDLVQERRPGGSGIRGAAKQPRAEQAHRSEERRVGKECRSR